MNDKKRIGNLINAKYKKLFFVGVLLLAAFLIFIILKQLGLFAIEPIGFIDYQDKPVIVQFCIETAWNESTSLVFTLRNCGCCDVNASDFAKTIYYIDNIETSCASNNNINAPFNTYGLLTVRCPAGSYGVCTELGCPIRVIQVKTAYGRKDTTTYQYRT